MTIQDFLRLMKVNAVFIICCVVVGGLLGFGYAKTQPKLYQSSAQATIVIAGTDAWSANSVAQQKAGVFAKLAGSAAVAQSVSQSLGLQDLGGSLTGAAEPSSPIVTITAVSSDPSRARDLANAAIPALGSYIASLEAIGSGQSPAPADTQAPDTSQPPASSPADERPPAPEPATPEPAPAEPRQEEPRQEEPRSGNQDEGANPGTGERRSTPGRGNGTGEEKEDAAADAGARIVPAVAGTGARVVPAVAGAPQAAVGQAGAGQAGQAAPAAPATAAPTDETYNSQTRLVALEPAQLPGAPFSPDTTKLAGMGGAGGLALGLAVAFLRRALDNKIRHNSDIEDILQSSVLAVVPRSTDLSAKGRRNVDGLGQAAEAIRLLRTNLRFVDVDNPPRAIVMTSANPGEGKSTISAVLAQMLAASGQRTILVDTDLRKPVVHRIFDIDGSVGLTQVLAGDVPVSDVAQFVKGHPHLRVIPAGRIPPNPSELLGSQRMKALLDRLSQEAVVLLDAPPLLPVTDAALLSALADGAILTFEVGGTYKEQARLTGKILGQVDARLLGVVLNRASRRSMGSVYYGYGYGSYGHHYYYGERPRGWRRLLPGGRRHTRHQEPAETQEHVPAAS